MRKRKRSLGGVLQVAAIAIVVLTARASFADQYVVPSGSMEPTVQVGDHIVVNKFAYGLRVPLTHTWLFEGDGPVRGDVVVLEADSPDVLLKRVVAVGGDMVEVRDGHVRIDGVVVDDSHADTSSDNGGPDFGPARVPDGSVFVLGDHRGNSRDGRFFGWIDQRHVLGRASAVVYRYDHLAYEPL